MDDESRSKGTSAVFKAFAGTIAIAICLVLLFSAIAKLLGPNTRLLIVGEGEWEKFADGVPRDYAIASMELLIAVGIAFLYRWKYAWSLVAIFFGGLLGYSAYALIQDVDCGCFGVLWTPPKGLTVGINSAAILASTILLLLARTNKGVIGLTLLLALGAGGLGYRQGHIDRPPTEEVVKKVLDGQSPIDRLLGAGIAELDDALASMDEQAGLTYVFVFEQGCSTCELYKPIVRDERDDYAEQGMPLAVVLLDNRVLAEEHGIPIYAWASTPTVFAVDPTGLVYYDRGEGVSLPSDLLQPWFDGEDLGGRDPDEDFGTGG